MLTLNELQQQFVLGLEGVDDTILHFINSDQDLTAKEHIAIYQNSVMGALQKSLKEVYPVCNKLVGNDFFIAMINIYIEQHASFSPDLAHYGSGLANFIAEFQATKSLPYLPDVARLEWAWHKIQSASETQCLDFQELANCYETYGENIVFSLPINSSLLVSFYPVHRIWEVNQDSFQGDNTIVLEDNMKFNFFIWRHRSIMQIEMVDEVEWKILNYIQAGCTLSEIYKNITATTDVEFEKILPTMVARGWLAEFTVK